MKIAPSAYSNDGKPREKPILTLIDDEEGVDIDDARATSYKLRTVPSDPDSAKYLYKVAILDGTCTPRQAIKWWVAMEKVFTGLNLTDSANRDNLLKEMLLGTAKSAYETGVADSIAKRHLNLRHAAVNALVRGPGISDPEWQAQRTTAWEGVAVPAINDVDVLAGIHAVINASCPYKALEKQKRFMRRKMRKPADMTTRTYVNILMRMNAEELIRLPPFKTNQGLGMDELIDIVCYGIPKSWVKKMDEHDFDPYQKSLVQLIAFCERMESAEDFDKNAASSKPTATSNKKSSKKHKPTRSNHKGGSKWCDFHEVDTHDTSECETLKKLKAARAAGSSDKKPAFKNKTWKRKSDDAKTYTKKELSAIVQKATKAAVKKASTKKKAECNAMAKRKADSDSESDTDSNCSVNMLDQMEAVDKQLAEFDFSEGEVSC